MTSLHKGFPTNHSVPPCASHMPHIFHPISTAASITKSQFPLWEVTFSSSDLPCWRLHSCRTPCLTHLCLPFHIHFGQDSSSLDVWQTNKMMDGWLDGWIGGWMESTPLFLFLCFFFPFTKCNPKYHLWQESHTHWLTWLPCQILDVLPIPYQRSLNKVP